MQTVQLKFWYKGQSAYAVVNNCDERTLNFLKKVYDQPTKFRQFQVQFYGVLASEEGSTYLAGGQLPIDMTSYFSIQAEESFQEIAA